MGKGGGGKAPSTQTVTTKNQPYLAGYVDNAAAAAQSLYNSQIGGFQNRNQIYQSLLPQYTSPATSGSLYVGPDGKIYDFSKQGFGVENPYAYANEAKAAFDLGQTEDGQAFGFRSMGAGGGGGVDYTGLNSAVDAAMGQDGGKYGYFPGSTVVPFSSETEAALAGITNRANAGSPLVGTAQDELLKTLRGDYLNANPYIDQVVNNVSRDLGQSFNNNVLPGLNSTFGGAGRTGSGQHGIGFGDATGKFLQELGDTSSQIRFGNFANERANQLTAMGLAPGLAAEDYKGFEALAKVGGARESLAQAKLQEDIDRYYFNQDSQGTLLDQYINRIGALNSGYGTQTQTNPVAKTGGASLLGGLGGAASGLGMISSLQAASPALFQGAVGALGPQIPGALSFLGGPQGLAIGAGLGLLGGLFG